MRSLVLIPILLLPLTTSCMTQRDRTIWAEFKAEISGSKSTVVDKRADDEADEAVEAPAG